MHYIEEKVEMCTEEGGDAVVNFVWLAGYVAGGEHVTVLQDNGGKESVRMKNPDHFPSIAKYVLIRAIVVSDVISGSLQ